MLLNLRGVSTPDEWENANDAKINAILQDLPMLIIGNPNREVNSQGEVIEYQPTYTGGSGWPENYEMAGSRDERETLSEKPGEVTSLEKSQGSGSRSSRGERRVSENYRPPYNSRVGGTGGTGGLLPVASGSGSPALTLSSTLVHQQRPVDSETTAMDTPLSPRIGPSRLLTVDVGARLGWFATPTRHKFAQPVSPIVLGDH